jgi:hypothetical protein
VIRNFQSIASILFVGRSGSDGKVDARDVPWEEAYGRPGARQHVGSGPGKWREQVRMFSPSIHRNMCRHVCLYRHAGDCLPSFHDSASACVCTYTFDPWPQSPCDSSACICVCVRVRVTLGLRCCYLWPQSMWPLASVCVAWSAVCGNARGRWLDLYLFMQLGLGAVALVLSALKTNTLSCVPHRVAEGQPGQAGQARSGAPNSRLCKRPGGTSISHKHSVKAA